MTELFVFNLMACLDEHNNVKSKVTWYSSCIGDIPALPQRVKADTRFSDPEGMQG